jgi:hypothetical protein
MARRPNIRMSIVPATFGLWASPIVMERLHVRTVRNDNVVIARLFLFSKAVASYIPPIQFAPLQTTNHGGVVEAPWFRCSLFGQCDGHGRVQVIQRRVVAHDTMVRYRLFKAAAEWKHSSHSHKLLPWQVSAGRFCDRDRVCFQLRPEEEQLEKRSTISKNRLTQGRRTIRKEVSICMATPCNDTQTAMQRSFEAIPPQE